MKSCDVVLVLLVLGLTGLTLVWLRPSRAEIAERERGQRDPAARGEEGRE